MRENIFDYFYHSKMTEELITEIAQAMDKLDNLEKLDK
jgi:hypothetical protein